MQHSKRTFVAGLAVMGCGPLLGQTSVTAPFPSGLIRIVPFGAPGGTVDAIARIYAEKLRLRWAQAVIVEPRPGASGTIAANFVAKAAPDGYTVLLTGPITQINEAILKTRLPYDPVVDFVALSQIGIGGIALLAKSSAPYNTLKELIEFSRSQKAVNYGTWGIGSSAHLFGELLKRKTSMNFVHIAYNSELAAIVDLRNGSLDLSWANPATARSSGGALKVLAIAATRRSSVFPDVPTFQEQGFPGFDLDSWLGLFAPAKVSAVVIETWATALREITLLPDVSAKLTGFGLEPLGNTPAQFRANYMADFPRVAKLIEVAGVRKD